MNSSLEATALRPIFGIGRMSTLVAVEVGEEQRHAVGRLGAPPRAAWCG